MVASSWRTIFYLREKMKILGSEIFRYLVAGILNTVIGVFFIYIFIFVGLNSWLSNFLGYFIGIMISFFINKSWTFRSDNGAFNEFLKFLLVIFIAYLSNLFVVFLVANFLKVDQFVAQLFGVPFYAGVGYMGSRWFVFGGFRKKKEDY